MSYGWQFKGNIPPAYLSDAEEFYSDRDAETVLMPVAFDAYGLIIGRARALFVRKKS